MKQVLVIEDNSVIREMTTDILEAHGFTAIAAEDGQLGIELAQNREPDMIICDIMMPGVDGYEVLAQLQQDPNTRKIPFIFLTAKATRRDMRHGMELGADDYLMKPFTPDELLNAINSRFEKQSVRDEESKQELESLRSSIALSLPHELRTPLNGILGLSEVLMDDYQNLPRQDILEIAQGIHQSGERLYHLVQNFLLYAELSTMHGDPKRVALLREQVTVYSQIPIANIATQVAKEQDRSDDLSLSLAQVPVQMADIQLEKLVRELVSNAFKFSNAGTLVELSTTQQGETFLLKICDRGRGMSPEQIAHLGAYMQFDRQFYEQQGSGLGLAIALQLVKLHGGEMVIDSEPGHQTCVTVTLPLGQLEDMIY